MDTAERDDKVSEHIKTLEGEAFEICNTNKSGQRSGDSFDERDLIETMLTSVEEPAPHKFQHLGALLIEFYSSIPHEHEHDSKGAIKLSSLKNDWAKKGVQTLARRMEGMWNKLNTKEEKEVVVKGKKDDAPATTSTKRRLSKKEKLKDRLIENSKTAISRMAVRKVSRNVTELMQTAAVNALCAGADPKDESFRNRVAGFIGTDLGRALISAATSMMLEVAPIPGLSQEMKEDLIAELHTDAFDQATMPVENMIKMFLPALSSTLTPLLDGNSQLMKTPEQLEGSNS